ncbi:MAG: hypothetical protein KC613_18475, partial [Myxococcales bacterium]|nr:hypothetical protein [Myxococcales bacterium]
GESYGTTRAAGIAHHLSERGVMFNGLLLISLALDFDTFVFSPANELPHVLIMPAYTATAAYHGKVDDGGDFRGLLAKARAFASGPYQQALFAGAALSPEQKASVAAELAALTGVEARTWLRNDLRLDQARFCRELLADEGKVVGRLDSRYVGRNDDPQDARATRDPSYDGPLGPFTVAVNDHLRRHIGYDDPKPYSIIDLKVNEG